MFATYVHDLSPVLIRFTDAIQLRWYGLAYLTGIAAGWWLAVRRSALPWSPVRREQVDDLTFYVALGVVRQDHHVVEEHAGGHAVLQMAFEHLQRLGADPVGPGRSQTGRSYFSTART